MRRKQSSSLLPVIAVGMIGAFLVVLYFSVAGPFPITPIIRLAQPTPSPTPPTFEAEQVVSRMYDAITNSAELAYMDAIPMASRSRIRPERILSGILEQSRFDAFNIEVPLDYLTHISYRKMTYSGRMQSDDYVLVHVNGSAYLAALKAEFPMCDTWDVRRYTEGWLVDIDAEERAQRMQDIAGKRLESKPPIASWPIIGWFWQRMNQSLEDAIREALNTCE